MPALRYVGLNTRSESALSGVGKTWWPGEISFIPQARAALLLAAGMGWETVEGGIVPRCARLAQLIGTKNAPLASLTGVTSGELLLPAPIKVPANFMEAGATLRVRALLDRTGATATANLACRFGTANAVGDSFVANIATAATDGLGLRLDGELRMQTATQAIMAAGTVLNTTAASGFTEVTTNINFAADQFVSFHMSAGNAADTFSVLAVTVDVEF